MKYVVLIKRKKNAKLVATMKRERVARWRRRCCALPDVVHARYREEEQKTTMKKKQQRYYYD